jgi:hypothetical protein
MTINLKNLIKNGVFFDSLYLCFIFFIYNVYLQNKTDKFLKSFVKDVQIEELNGILSSISHE